MKLLNFSRPKWFKYFFSKNTILTFMPIILCLILSSLIGMKIPVIIMDVFQSIGDEDLYWANLKSLLYIFIIEYFIRVVYQVFVNWYVKIVVGNVRFDVFSRWINFSGKDQKKNSKDYVLGEVLSRIVNDTESLRDLVVSGAFGILIDLFFVISCFVSFLKLNYSAGVSLIFVELVVMILLILTSKYIAKYFYELKKTTGMMSRYEANITGGMREIFFYDSRNYSSIKCEKIYDEFLNKQLKANFFNAGYFSIAESLFPLLLALIVLFFPSLKLFEIAIIGVLIDLIQRSIDPVKRLTSRISNIQQAYTGIKRINEFNEFFTIESAYDNTVYSYEDLEIKQLCIKIKSFTYDQNNLDSGFQVSDINFNVNYGQFIGIVGESGCGKSTVLKIIDGIIIGDGIDVNLIDQNDNKISSTESYYKNYVGLISQESHVFSSNLKFNITLGHDKEDKFDLFWKAMCVKVKYLNDWLDPIKDIIDPKTISLGQKQLISGIRSCFFRKPIVLLDEISSSLDSALEIALRSIILQIGKNSITIIVAHRIETIIRADIIFVMEYGKIKSMGNHENLLKSSIKYNELISKLK
jgi:ATP-binding cassette, subfamily B, multidrug efflux pump